MPDDPERAERYRPEEPVIAIRRPGAAPLSLTLSEYRLALLGLVDFEGDWEALEQATHLVIDGSAKARLVRERVLPAAPHLSVLLARGVDSLEMLTARHWFRSGQV